MMNAANKPKVAKEVVKEPKVDYRRKQPNGLLKNKKCYVPLACYGFTGDDKEYDPISLLDLMEDLQKKNVFSLVSVPVYMSRTIITGNPEFKNRTIIGYMKSFNVDRGECVIMVYSGRTDSFETLKDPVINARVMVKNDKAVCIIGFDVVERSTVSNK